jgi:hypothetical protein
VIRQKRVYTLLDRRVQVMEVSGRQELLRVFNVEIVGRYLLGRGEYSLLSNRLELSDVQPSNLEREFSLILAFGVLLKTTCGLMKPINVSKMTLKLLAYGHLPNVLSIEN